MTLRSDADDGYVEGAVTNTRFGSFPHSTLIGLEWGSQVRASKVDTGSRGRKGKGQGKSLDNADGAEPITKKRKSDEIEPVQPEVPTKKVKQLQNEGTNGEPVLSTKAPIQAGSGFVHILQPTPEAWTSSLDHRTQVVYTPDYSYILQRLRVRPGSTIIEAGAGSGSFTHAAARAVYNGNPSTSHAKQQKFGKVYSYEYHEPRVQTLRQEIHSHGLNNIVHLTHRDVCNDGFALDPLQPPPAAEAVFLDLPAPWLALKHLSRNTPGTPLNPHCPSHLCTFSPCIEQVLSTVSSLRKTGWTEIEMLEIQHKRLDVRREHVGLQNEGLRGVNASAGSVEEAVARLREVETKLSDFHAGQHNSDEKDGESGSMKRRAPSKAERLERIRSKAQGRKLYKEGKLVHRSEAEVKTHTSYLVFAVLPPVWSEEQERECLKRWSAVADTTGGEKTEGKLQRSENMGDSSR